MKARPTFRSRNAIYVVVTACALGAAACQPVEMDQSSPGADHAVQKMNDQADRRAERSRK